MDFFVIAVIKKTPHEKFITCHFVKLRKCPQDSQRNKKIANINNKNHLQHGNFILMHVLFADFRRSRSELAHS